MKQANQSRERVFRLGLAYAAGVFAWFLGFAALVVALKAAGHQVGYAFHLQNPWFLVGLSAVTFVFALNLLGVFEVILPGSVTGAAGEVAGSREGYTGAFLQGMLATVLGSACTAPFFGPALGFAFSQSGPVIFAMFAAIAAGMSAPFVLLAWQPGWMKFLPRPGAWMERVKQGNGFPVIGNDALVVVQPGTTAGARMPWSGPGVLLLVLGAACWVQGAFNTLVATDRVRWASRAVIAVLVLGGGWACVDQIAHAAPPVVSNQTFAMQLDAAQKTGRTVFVDFTAEWCVSYKANECVVLRSDAVKKALRDDNVLVLKADFTTYSEDIAKLLKQFNAPSVPLYVIYPAGKPDSAHRLADLADPTNRARRSGRCRAPKCGEQARRGALSRFRSKPHLHLIIMKKLPLISSLCASLFLAATGRLRLRAAGGFIRAGFLADRRGREGAPRSPITKASTSCSNGPTRAARSCANITIRATCPSSSPNTRRRAWSVLTIRLIRSGRAGFLHAGRCQKGR